MNTKRCLSIHLTDLCNSKCSFCVVGSPLYTKDRIKYEKVEKFLRDNADQGFEVVNLHGGEPTIHPKFLETLKLIRSLGYPEVHVQTNGVTLSKKELAEQMVENGVKLFIISLHGDTAEVQDGQTRTVDGFVRTIQGIRNVSGIGARVRTNTVVTKQNVERLTAISQLAIEIGVHHLNYSNIHPVGSAVFGLSRISPHFEAVRRCLYPAIELASERGIRVTLEGFPYCTVKEKATYHLNNEYRNIRMLYADQIFDYDTFMNVKMREYGQPCRSCVKRELCGGVYKEYIDLRGWGEFSTLTADAFVPALEVLV